MKFLVSLNLYINHFKFSKDLWCHMFSCSLIFSALLIEIVFLDEETIFPFFEKWHLLLTFFFFNGTDNLLSYEMDNQIPSMGFFKSKNRVKLLIIILCRSVCDWNWIVIRRDNGIEGGCYIFSTEVYFQMVI